MTQEDLEALKVHQDKALRRYAEKFGRQQEGNQDGFNRREFSWTGHGHSPAGPKGRAEKADQAELDAALLAFQKAGQSNSCKRQPRLKDLDSEGERITLCAHCLLPVGENAYAGKEDKTTSVHGECMAQLMLQEIQEKDHKRLQEEAETKEKNKKEYSIGWDVASVPSNAVAARRLGLDHCPNGLCCLVLDEGSQTVRVAATHEPTAAVNLEYLLLALRARCHACREPLFSLDPVDPENIETTMQAKRYEPKWLAGTSVGEVMFQADYFLKELAMGDHGMPVLGMMSVFDWSDTEPTDKPWTGREWFVVKKAEIRMAADNTLIPHVKMGVEAREQQMTRHGLQDVPCNNPNHPLQKFAEAFTKNFDLIAERKSVIFHLRELAKASVMAKFLMESGTLPVEWLKIADGIVKDAKPDECMEIPQLWNMRGQSRIQVVGGKILNSETGQWSQLRSVYGGIEFGLDRFELAQRHMLRPVGVTDGSTMQMPIGLQGMQLGPTGRPGFAPSRFQLTQRPLTQPSPQEQPQGVDLNLDKFELSAPDRFAGVLPACSSTLDSLEAKTLLGKSFLQSIRDGSTDLFKADDASLLKDVYFSSLSDRMDEDDAFVPPDPDAKYIAKLRNLVSEEEDLKQRRRRKFTEASFVVGKAGSEFPTSWTSSFQVDNHGLSTDLMQAALASSLVKLVVEKSFSETLVRDVLPSATPEFEKPTEDGTQFRIYRFGSLEVRTIQEISKAEVVEAVFSMRPITWQPDSVSEDALRDGERLAKVTMYVEAINVVSELNRSLHGKAALLSEEGDAFWQSHALDHCNYYLVLETDAGNKLVTEKLSDGSVGLAVNPANLTNRNSLARLLYSADCAETGVSVRDFKVFRNQSARQTPSGACPSERQVYVKNVFKLACGKARLVRKGKGTGKGPAPGAARAPMQPQARKTYSCTVNYGRGGAQA
eukprot:TRINITY_DN354_c0_g3_i1.p1 TRINITY_DN354_c0_g3~~TRINITY_DN354_c0_g3_i1.p1  ORF type:complete len:1007 (+),score=209.76 TRINITY_DN354_c0_g3_i1:206-3022(+)